MIRCAVIIEKFETFLLKDINETVKQINNNG